MRLISMNQSKLLLAVMLLALATACSDSDDEKAQRPPESAETLYTDARNKYSDGNFKEAVKAFEEVERQHPSSEWAVNAQVMSGYANYKVGEYDAAASTWERFVKLYPNNESTPYVYYMIAMCYYDQITDVGRDQKVTEQAMQALREVIRRFPESEYARDAKIKLDLTMDHMAGKEMQVGRYYLRNQQYIAAINRFRFVVENHQTTSHVPEALHRLVEAFLKLGVTEEAMRYAAVLGHNFPNNIWYRDTYDLLSGGAKPSKEMEEEAQRYAKELKELSVEEPTDEDRANAPDEKALKKLPPVSAPFEPVSSTTLETTASKQQEKTEDTKEEPIESDGPSIWEKITPW
jgi:outer membrane protein assembly factor BamD